MDEGRKEGTKGTWLVKGRDEWRRDDALKTGLLE